MSPEPLPLLSLSLDADNKWAYMKTHGDPGWETFPGYLEDLAEIGLRFFDRKGIRLTFFLVGQDAALERNRPALRALADAGHEIGNHSFHHEPWMASLDAEALRAEVQRAEAAIEEATGKRPRGFRGPGFASSPKLLEILAERNYLYDASSFPTFLGPLARIYYFWKARGLSEEERKKRRNLFGTWKDGFAPLAPFSWEVDGKQLIEIPVTTMPVFRVPIHQSYLLWLVGRSRLLARLYLRKAFLLCRMTRTPPSFLLHPLDLLGRDKVEGLEFFPGMNLDTKEKLVFLDEVLSFLSRRYRIVPMEIHARETAEASETTRRPLRSGRLPA